MLRISFFPTEQDRIPRSLEITWEQLAAQLSAPRASPCVGHHDGAFDEWDGFTKSWSFCLGSKCVHKLGPAWSPAAYQVGTTRGKSNVASVACLVLDLDHMSEEELGRAAHVLEPYRYIAHASHSDRPGDRCLRVVLELDSPVPGEDWPRFWSTVVAELDLPVDRSTCDASRIYFLPSRPSGTQFLSDTNEGRKIGVADVMSRAPAAAPKHSPATVGSSPLPEGGASSLAAAELALVWPERGRHHAFLALAGALASAGWPEDSIEDFTIEVARRMTNCDTKAIADRGPMARDSVDKVKRGEAVTGWGYLSNVLSRPDAIGVVRGTLGIRDPDVDAVAAVFADVIGAEVVPDSGSEVPNMGINELVQITDLSQLDLSGLDMPRSLVGAAPEVAAEPGTFLAYLQEARRDLAAALGTSEVAVEAHPLFEPARDLFSRSFPSTPWLVQGLIAEGGIAMIGAEPKHGKSWVATDIAASVASGTDALGRFRVTRPAKVAYYYAEDLAQSIRNRLRALAAGRGITPEDMCSSLHVQPRGRHLDLTRDEDLAQLIASCRMIGGVGLLVVDPLRDVHAGKENESDDMSALFARLRVASTLLSTPERMCTILIVHHAKKPTQTSGDDRAGNLIRGSSVIFGAVDSLIMMTDLCGDLVSTFSSTVESTVKAAKSAGSFDLTLTIKDGADGTAERAAWSGAIDGKSADLVSEVMARCLEHMCTAEIKKLKVQGHKELCKAAAPVKGDIVTAAMIDAVNSGFALKNLIGTRHIGWVVTDAGRAFVRQLSEPAPSAEASPEVRFNLASIDVDVT